MISFLSQKFPVLDLFISLEKFAIITSFLYIVRFILNFVVNAAILSRAVN